MAAIKSAEEKIVSREQLAKIVSELKAKGKIVVSTNGAFDLMHAGHVFLLEEAKKLGDVLVVGVNTDASVRAYKSPDRPIVPERERALMLAAVHCVDYVCLFNEPHCMAWLEQIKPSIHVKDANAVSKNGKLIENETLEKIGAKTVLVERKKGLSTTNIIEKILQVYSKK